MKPLLPRTDCYFVPIQLPFTSSVYLPSPETQFAPSSSQQKTSRGAKKVRIAPKVLTVYVIDYIEQFKLYSKYAQNSLLTALWLHIMRYFHLSFVMHCRNITQTKQAVLNVCDLVRSSLDTLFYVY